MDFNLLKPVLEAVVGPEFSGKKAFLKKKKKKKKKKACQKKKKKNWDTWGDCQGRPRNA